MQPDRSKAPAFQLSDQFNLPVPVVRSISENANLYFLGGLRQEAVKVEWVFRSAKYHEQIAGQSHFAFHLLPKGTARQTAYEIAEAFDLLGAHVEITPGFDNSSISLYVLRSNLKEGLILIGEILDHPAFPQDELEQMQQQQLQVLQINQGKTAFVASRAFRKALFGDSHPYGSTMEESHIRNLRQQNVIDFHRKKWPLEAVYVVGALSSDELDAIASVWSSSGNVSESIASIQPGAGQSLHMEGKVQCSIRMGRRTLPRTSTQEYYAATLFNHLLGGYFGSRLMKNIREDKGLTYGIYSGLQHFRHDSFWVISAEVNQQNQKAAIDEIRNEIEKLVTGEVPSAEVEAATNYFIGSWQSENSTLFAVAEKYRGLHFSGLTSEFYNGLLQFMRHPDLDLVKQVGRTHFHADDLTVVTAGG